MLIQILKLSSCVVIVLKYVLNRKN